MKLSRTARLDPYRVRCTAYCGTKALTVFGTRFREQFIHARAHDCKIFFAQPTDRNLSVIREFARIFKQSSTDFPNNSLAPL